RAAIEREGFGSLLNAQVRVGDQVFGTFGIGFRAPHTFSDAEKRLSAALAQRAGLAIQNARLHEESEQRWQELETLYRADEALHRSLRLDDVLQALADVAPAVLRAEKCSVAIWSDSGDSVRVAAERGFGPRARAVTPAAVEARALRDRFAEAEFIQAMTDELPAGSELRTLYEQEGIRSTLAATIGIAGEVFGAFAVHAAERRSFDAQEQRRLLALARRAGLAVQNARLYEQAQQAATLEERQRLARELHDAVTQTLFSTALMAEVIPELWAIDPVEAQQRLAELRRLTRGALAEMRTLLVELRPGALTELPLADLLRQLAEATEGRRRLQVLTRAEGAPRPLPAAIQVALYRTAQEAINNVVKHARARRVAVQLGFEPDGAVRLQVSDDGCGFDPEAVPAGHLGVRIMRERAAAIGARFQLRSQPGAGSVVEVHWRP
ncbi:MAG: sensor histidine kinase, partial [Chloroflexi bacterium]|nr:sensor histidine kinase [Chloroflexota bacterium]